MITSPVIKVTSRLLRANVVRGFCFEKGMLDPSKHIFMNHVPHNIYSDYWEIGQYPQLITVHSIAPRTYESKVKSIILQTINTQYGVQLTEEDIINEQIDHLLKYVVKTDHTVEQFFSPILKNLSTGIFVKESKWTWILEQQSRYSPGFNSLVLREDIKNIPDFLSVYNAAIQRMVLTSHLGTSSKIIQPPSPQEKQLFNELNDQITGVTDLTEERRQNQSFINRFLRIIHSA